MITTTSVRPRCWCVTPGITTPVGYVSPIEIHGREEMRAVREVGIMDLYSPARTSFHILVIVRLRLRHHLNQSHDVTNTVVYGRQDGNVARFLFHGDAPAPFEHFLHGRKHLVVQRPPRPELAHLALAPNCDADPVGRDPPPATDGARGRGRPPHPQQRRVRLKERR